MESSSSNNNINPKNIPSNIIGNSGYSNAITPNLFNYSNSDNSINSSIATNKFRYFIPWKRAESDPSIVKRGTEIHISPLSSDITHEELFSILKGYGDIIDLRIIPRKDKGNCFSFVRFMEKESVFKIMTEQIFIRGTQVRISRSKEETTIFIGNIKKTWSKEYIESAMRERVPQFDELRFLKDPNDLGKNRGFCFLRYDNPVIAREAYDKLSRNIIIDSTSITVDWADEFSDQDVNKVQIHLSGIKDNIKTEDLYTVFGQYGEIINIKLARDLEGKDRKDYGFITYSKEEEAERAVREFSWKEYFESPMNVQFARKMASIIKHKQKVQGDMLEKKRRRDNIIKNQKKYGNSDSEVEEEDTSSNRNKIDVDIMNQFTSMLNKFKNANSNANNLGDMMTQMMGLVSKAVNNESNNKNESNKKNINRKKYN